MPAVGILSGHQFKLQTARQISQVHLKGVSTMFEIFHSLVLELPSNIIVFCIIDAVTTYETSSVDMKDGDEAVRCLMGVVQQSHELGYVFKLMLTSPKNSHGLYKLVPDQASDSEPVASYRGFYIYEMEGKH